MSAENRTLIAAFFIMAAVLVALPLAADGAPILDWWLVLVLAVLGALLLISTVFDFTRMEATGSDLTETLPAPTRSYQIPARTQAAAGASGEPTGQAPLMPRMTIPEEERKHVSTDPVPTPEPREGEPGSHPEQVVERTDTNVLPFLDVVNVRDDVEPENPPTDQEDIHQLDDPTEKIVQDMTAAPQQPETETAVESAQALAEDEKVDPQVERTAKEAAAPPVPPDRQEPDDLTRIFGIGPKSAAALQAAGIDTFAKLAAADTATIENALTASDVRLVGSVDTWSQQAAYAARGDWDGLNDYIAQTRDDSAG